MFATLLPSSMAPISRARASSNRRTAVTRLDGSPLSSALIRAREVAVSAVSAAEKQADTTMQTTTTPKSSHSSDEGAAAASPCMA